MPEGGSFYLAYQRRADVLSSGTWVAPATTTVWNPLRIDGGGFVTGLQIASDGTRFARTDTAGAWIWVPGATSWTQVMTMQSMPAADRGPGWFSGVYSIAIARSNSQRLYLYHSDVNLTVGYIYRSDDRGASWTRTAFPSHIATGGSSGNPETRLSGPYMVVDPVNPDIVFAGTPSSGLWTTSNGGTSWTQVSTGQVPVSTTGGASQGQGHCIGFDTTSSTASGFTHGIYATSYGHGVYHSTDGGSTWTVLNSTGMPTTHTQLIVDQTGVLWMTDGTNSGGGAGELWRYNGAWQNQSLLMSDSNHYTLLTGVAVNPSNAAQVFTFAYYGNMYVTTTGTAATPTWLGPTTFSIVSSAIPWIQAANDGALSVSPIVFDPLQSGVLIAGTGIGVFHTTPPTTNSNVQWNGDDTLGIQNLVSTYGFSIPGGPLLLNAWDRPAWVISNPAATQANYFPNYAHEIVRGLDASCALTNTSLLIELDATNGAAVSSNGGASWSIMAALPPSVPGTYLGGTLRAYSNTNAVWLLSNGGGPYCLTGGSLTGTPVWSAATFNNGATVGGGGWNDSSFYVRTALAIDQVDTTTYYLYNDGTGSNPAGIYKSTNGTSFVIVHSGAFSGVSAAYFAMFAVPGQSGHLFAGAMAYGNGVLPETGKGLWKSTDHGATWAQVPNIYSMFGFSLGAIKSGGTYPSFYAFGWASTDGGSTYNYGAWRSDNINQATPTWISIGDGFPNGNYDYLQFVAADANTYGKVYVGFGGSGYAYGALQ